MRAPEQSPIPADRDFGGLFVKVPREIRAPGTIEELAETLKHYNRLSTPVTIRNTGHSMNGMSLTDGVQIQLAGLNRVRFDEERLLVHAEAGVSWYALMHAIRMPEYCTAVFPNSPRQEIHVGGTAAVGGTGFFSAKYGGFWNIVEALTLVTMEGDIIECSREKNPELFAYSLGGYGRIGVIAAVTVRVKKTENKLLALAMAYHSEEKLMQDAEVAIHDPLFSGISVILHPFLHFETLGPGIKPCALIALVELENGVEPDQVFALIKSRYHEDATAYLDFFEDKQEDIFDVHAGFRRQLMTREEIVYWYPDEGVHGEGIANPWAGFLIPPESYLQFVRESRKLIDAYDMRKFLLRQRVNSVLDYHLEGGYALRNTKKDHERYHSLGQGSLRGDYAFAHFIFLGMPASEASRAVQMINELNNVCFRMGGIRYMYTAYGIAREQIEQQYGADTLAEWRHIKSQLDSKGLLNRGVIPHLDD